MARIRSIKPELLEDERTAMLSDLEWRTFVSLLLLADDYGNFRANPGRIAGAAFWAQENVELAPTLERLSSGRLIRLYEVEGQRYGHIRGWSKHQKVDHPGKPTCPPPPMEDSRDSRENGEGVEKLPEVLAPDLNGSDLIGREKKAPRREPREYPQAFEDFWRALAAVGRLGNSNKSQTCDEWTRLGKPDGLPERWRQYLGSLPDWQSPRHVNRWLKSRGHEQTYAPPEAQRPSAVNPYANVPRWGAGGMKP